MQIADLLPSISSMPFHEAYALVVSRREARRRQVRKTRAKKATPASSKKKPLTVEQKIAMLEAMIREKELEDNANLSDNTDLE